MLAAQTVNLKEVFGNIAEVMPQPDLERWSPRHKQVIVEAVLSGHASLPAILSSYQLSMEEFLNWQRYTTH